MVVQDLACVDLVVVEATVDEDDQQQQAKAAADGRASPGPGGRWSAAESCFHRHLSMGRRLD